METKKIYEILVDDINRLDDDDKRCNAFILFVISAASSIIKKAAQSIIESGEIPTINKCIERLDADRKLMAQISVIFHTMLCASIVADDKWNPEIMYDLVKFNFDVIDKDLQRFLQDEPDEDEEFD